MEKRNKLLEKKVNFLEYQNLALRNNELKSYVNIVSKTISSTKKIPPIIVKPKYKNDKDFINDIKTQINISNLKLSVNNFKVSDDGSV